MADAKYIVLANAMEIIVFPSFLQHDDMARRMTDPRRDVKEQVVSAGFCQIWEENGEVKYNCYGHSESLHLEADVEQDSKLLKRLFDAPF